MAPASSRSVRARNPCSPGSTSPERVPITSPCSGVRPIEVSTAAPWWIADAEHPLPRWSTIWSSSSVGRPTVSAARAET